MPTDPVWRGLFRDLRFRKALALGLDRDAISQYLYAGLAVPANNTILPDSPLWQDEYGAECVAFDPDTANALLDELGLDKRRDDGTRLLPDGRPMEIVVETSGEDSEQSDVLEIVADQWAAIGFKIVPKPSDRQIMRTRVYAGSALMSMFFGIDNGVPAAVPAAQGLRPDQPGRPAAMAEMGSVLRDQRRGRRAARSPRGQAADGALQRVDDGERGTRDRDLAGDAEDLFQPVLHDRPGLRRAAADRRTRKTCATCPSEAIFNWEPHGQFGIYLPDTFWYEQ